MKAMRPVPILGVYERPFWARVQQRSLHLQRCGRGHFRFPPGPECPRCLSPAFTWEPVAGRGRLISWTTFHRQYFREMPVPYTVVCGQLAEGPLLIADLSGAHDQPLILDMPLWLVFEDVETKGGPLVIYRWSTEIDPI